MTEEFLHHIWKFRLFDQIELTTTLNENIEIIRTGDHNFDSGPDFFNAKIRIGNTLWAGNVEVHINASDWNKHRHQSDKAYDNIILHVVNNADMKLYRSSGEEIPTIEIKNRISAILYENYLRFKNADEWIPCSRQVALVPSLIITGTIDKLLLERLERKSQLIINSLILNNNNWEETFYQLIARNFGFKINSEPFELLAKSLPSIVLSKQKNSQLQVEALLFGQAGLLNEHFEDAWPRALQNEFAFLSRKFSLTPIDAHLWKYLRLRPVNFPVIRIAQFANLIYKSSGLFSKVLEITEIAELKELFNVTASEYWNTHYVFDRPSKAGIKHLGEDGINNIIINSIVPFLFVYGKQKGNERFVERSLHLLEQLKEENNSISKKWKSLRLPVNNAYASQALLQLKTEYCSQKKCLSCSIGNYLLKNS